MLHPRFCALHLHPRNRTLLSRRSLNKTRHSHTGVYQGHGIMSGKNQNGALQTLTNRPFCSRRNISTRTSSTISKSLVVCDSLQRHNLDHHRAVSQYEHSFISGVLPESNPSPSPKRIHFLIFRIKPLVIRGLFHLRMGNHG